DVAGAGGVVVELADSVLDLGLRSRPGEVDADRLDADLGAVLVLAPDIPARTRVITDQDRAEPGRDALLRQRSDPAAQLLLDRSSGGGAVELACSHRVVLSRRRSVEEVAGAGEVHRHTGC